MFVCVSRKKFMHNPRMLWHIFTQFDTQMHLGLVQNLIDFQTDQINILVKMYILDNPHLLVYAFISLLTSINYI